MNIFRILSQVLNWDIKVLQKRATKIEKDSNAPPKAQLMCLKQYADKSGKEQAGIRERSSR
jgi:hypothetical protein